MLRNLPAALDINEIKVTDTIDAGRTIHKIKHKNITLWTGNTTHVDRALIDLLLEACRQMQDRLLVLEHPKKRKPRARVATKKKTKETND